jgi:hypothetical protein
MDGAVKTPSADIVPTVALPPGTPATLHVTLVSAAFDTVAENSAALPNSTGAPAGITLTDTGGGPGGGGGGDVAPAQPDSHTPSVIRQKDSMPARFEACAPSCFAAAIALDEARRLPASPCRA